MNINLVALQVESFLRFIYGNEAHYASAVRSHPWEEILSALTIAKSKYPAKSDMIQFYIDRYKDMGDKSLNALAEEGYDLEGLIADLNGLEKILME